MEKREMEFKALGTDIYLQIVCAENLTEKAEEELIKLRTFYCLAEKIFSRFDVDSELNHFNQNLGGFAKASPHFLAVAKKNLHYFRLSNGVFDPRVIEVLELIGYAKDFKQNRPVVIAEKTFSSSSDVSLEKDLIIRGEEVAFKKRMDFAGIAKGYITDAAGEMLVRSGFQDFLLDSGGDILALGRDQKEEEYRIDVEGIANERVLINLSNEAIATSGIGRRKWESDGKRFHHLIDPKNPEKFSFNLQSVTVVASTAIEADFLAKMLFIRGARAGKKFSNENKIKSIFLDYRGNAWISAEMKNNI